MPSDVSPNLIAGYQPAPKSARHSGQSDLLFNLTAPVVASRLVFPRLLDRSVDAAREGREPVFVANAHARWFFGHSLVLWVDPAELRWRLRDWVHDGRQSFQLSRRFVDHGDWSEILTPTAETGEHREMLEMVAYGARYARSPTFRRMMRRARKGKPVRRYDVRLDTEEKVHAYFRYFLGLIDSVREHGLQDFGSLANLQVPSGFNVRGRYARHNRNIGVAVGADGGLLRFLGGRHRTAIAQALGLAAVPVEIRFVHAAWLADEKARSGLSAAEALRHWVRQAPDPRLRDETHQRGERFAAGFSDRRRWARGQVPEGAPVPGE